MIGHYLIIAWRSLQKNRFRYLFTAVNLALGMVVLTLTLYMIIQEERVYTQFEHHRQIAAISFINTVSGDQHAYKQHILTDLLSQAAPGVTKVAFFRTYLDQAYLEKETDQFLPYMCESARVNKDFFQVFSSAFIAGDADTWDEKSAVITTRFSKKVYGDKNPIGKTISIGGNYYQITGIIEPYTSQGIVSADIYLTISENEFFSDGGYALLGKGADITQINTTLSGTKVAGSDALFRLRKLSDSKERPFRNIMVILLSTISILVLVLAFINFMNLSGSALLSRLREITLRKTVGAQNRSIRLWAVMTDLFLLLLSILIAASMLELIIHMVNTRGITQDIGGLWFEPQYLYLSLIAIFIVILICYLIFMNLAVTGINKRISLQGIQQSLGKGKRHKIRNILLLVQLAICFLFTGITLGLQIQYKKSVDAYLQSRNIENLESSRILELNLNSIESDKYWNNREAIRDEIEEIKEIESILFTNFSLFPYETEIKRNPEDPSPISVLYTQTDKNYFSFFRLDDPETDENGGEQTLYIVNDALARLLDESDQSSFFMQNSVVNIHRVVNSLPLFPDNKPGYVEIANEHASQFYCLYLRCMPGQTATVQRQINEIIEQYVPSYPVETTTLKKIINSRSGNIIVFRDIFLIVSIITLIISMFGIYSAIISDTQQREQEVAIRKVNGAKVMDILYLFGRLYLKLMLLSFIISLPFLLFALQFLFSMVNSDVSILHLSYWIQLITIVGGFVFITLIFRIWRTALINPATIITKD